VANWKVSLTDDAKADFKGLDGSEKILIAKQLLKLERNPDIGQPSGSKMGMDLTGYFKLYADRKRIRIVYAIEGDLVKVIAVGKREDMEIYRLASKRYSLKPE
jgi:mRNA-degrading endonuclease RelE of RelBE toxin-antitoxin system